MEKKKILLTGATGFLGSHLANALLLDPCNEISILKRSFSSLLRIKNIMNHLHSYDIDQISLAEIFSKTKFDYIIHTAVEYGRDSTSCVPTLETNLMFPIALLEEAIKGGVHTFINTDSYFNKEHFAYSHLLHYALSKKSLEAWLKYFSKKIKIINICLEHMYGPYDSSSKFVENMIQSIVVKPQKEVNLTYGQQKRDFIYVDDVTKAYQLLLDISQNEKFHYRTYNLGTGTVTSIRNFVELIKERSSSHTQLNFGELPYREDEIMNSVADNLELKNLGWTPKVNVEEGIKRILKEYELKIA